MPRRLSYETRAKMRNNRIAKQLPLFAAAGMLDEVVGRPPWTAEEVRADEETRQRHMERFFEAAAQGSQAQYAAYRAWLVELVSEAEVQRREAERDEVAARWGTLQNPAYRADWMNRQLAEETGLTPLVVYQTIGARMEVGGG